MTDATVEEQTADRTSMHVNVMLCMTTVSCCCIDIISTFIDTSYRYITINSDSGAWYKKRICDAENLFVEEPLPFHLQ
jgi:hypothetical protein